MTLKIRFILLASALTLLATTASWVVFDRLTTTIVEQWGQRVAETQVYYDTARLLQPLEREIALARQMAESPAVLRLARQAQAQEHESAALAEMERFRRNFGGGNYFVALRENGAYYFNNGENEYAGEQLRYHLDAGDPDDAWFYRLIDAGRDFHLNVNPDSELGVTKLWIDVLMRDPTENERILGVVGTGLDLDAMLDETVGGNQPGITTVFVDHTGAIQLYRDRSLIDFASLVKPEGQKSRLDRMFDTVEDRQRIKALLERVRQSATSDTPVRTDFVFLDGKRHLAGAAWLPQMGWYEVTLLDLDVLMPVSRFLPVLLVFLFVLLVSIGVLHLALQRLLLRPINALEDAMQSVKKGRFDPSQLPQASGEMGRLVSHFGSMAESIQNHTQQLEQTVEERTRDLNRLARIDPLTDLFNRRGMQEAFEKTCSRSQREKRPVALLWLDIDEFKEINDGQGHEAGDQVLVDVAACIREELRPYDDAARWGGDEFLVMLYPAPEDRLTELGERIRRTIESNVHAADRSVTVSIGGYRAQPDESIDRILALADKALYQAKKAGRNRVCIKQNT